MEILETFTLFDSILPTTTGIYRIYNKLNGNQYIGSASSVPQGFNGRFNYGAGAHRVLLKNNAHHCKKLQQAFNEILDDGLDPNNILEIQIIEYVEPDFCLQREQWYLDNCTDKYNSSIYAIGGPRTDESKAKAREIRRSKNIALSKAYVAVRYVTGDIVHIDNLYLFCEEMGWNSLEVERLIEKQLNKGREYGDFGNFRFYPYDCSVSATLRASGRLRVRMINGGIDVLGDGPDFWIFGDPRPKLPDDVNKGIPVSYLLTL